jgi:membrane protein involved in colicin uptake
MPPILYFSGGVVSCEGSATHNVERSKFRKPKQQANASWQKFGTSEKTETPFGAKQKSEQGKAEKEKLNKIFGARQKQRETPGKSGTTSRKGPPGQRNRQTGGGEGDEFDRLVAMIENIRKTL